MTLENLLVDCGRSIMKGLNQLSTEELSKVADSSILLDGWIKKDPKYSAFIKNVEAHRKVRAGYKEIDRQLKLQIAMKHDSVRDKKSSVRKMKIMLEKLKKEKNQADEANSFSAFINVLEVMVAENDEDAESFLQYYLDHPEEMDISTFESTYFQMRTKSHAAKERKQRLKEVMAENQRALKNKSV